MLFSPLYKKSEYIFGFFFARISSKLIKNGYNPEKFLSPDSETTAFFSPLSIVRTC